MLMFVGFQQWEIDLLVKTAAQLGVRQHCQFVSVLGDWDVAEQLINLNNLLRPYPSVIFLNGQRKNDHWLQNLSLLKADEILNCIPVVVLGNLSRDQIQQFYENRGNSYIAKPNSFEEMMKASEVTLKYWLKMTHLPAKFLD